MIVQCPSCEARYRIGTENVPEQGGKISCPSCAQSFIVYPEAPDINDDETRAGTVPFVLQNMGGEPVVEDGTVEIQNPMRTWLESQKNLHGGPADEAATSVLNVGELDLPFDNFSSDDGMDDKTEMINLGDFLELENSEVEYDATEVFTLADHEAQSGGALTQNIPPPSGPKPTLMGQGLPPLQRPSGLPPLQKPSGLPPLQKPSGLPPLQKPSGLPPLRQPSALPPLQQPSALPPVQQPSALPPVQQPSALPPVQQPPAQQPFQSPAVQPPMMQGSLSQPVLAAVAVANPAVSPVAELGVGQQNVQSDPNFNGPWKLRTNFGLTYEFPDTMSLNSWISSREDVSGYTLAGSGDFYPLSYFPQIRPKHAGTSGSFSLHQPTGLPSSDFLNAQPNTQIPDQFAPVGNANPANQIPMLQQPTDYKAFSKSDTNIPQKETGGILPLIAWGFCGISGLMMVATALYVFGIIGASSPGLLTLVHLF